MNVNTRWKNQSTDRKTQNAGGQKGFANGSNQNSKRMNGLVEWKNEFTTRKNGICNGGNGFSCWENRDTGW